MGMLQHAGRPNYAKQVSNEAALIKLLEQKTWDLLIATDHNNHLNATTAIRTISQQEKDIPVILLTEHRDTQAVVEGLKMGARDVVVVDEDQHLLLVIHRELTSLNERRTAQLHNSRHHVALSRTKELLDSSKEAIAYISDGLLVYANDSFAERLGYSHGGEMSYQPLIDMLVESEQPYAREFLRQCAIDRNEIEAQQWSFTAITAAGSLLTANAEVLSTTFDDELCLQLRLAATETTEITEELHAQLNEAKNRDAVTGLYNRPRFVHMLETAIQSSADSQRTGGLIYLEINHFEETVQNVVGVAGVDLLHQKFAELLRENTGKDDILARYGDESYCWLIPNTSPDHAEARARELHQKISDTIFDTANKTLHITIAAGISLFSETSDSAQQVLDQALKAHAKVQDATGGGYALYEPNSKKQGDSDTYHRARLVQALESNKLKLLYQPILSLQGNNENIYEVLVRLVDGKEELLPIAFLETFGNAGLSSKMDRWVILTALKIAAAEHRRGKHIFLLLHLTVASLLDTNFPLWLAKVFKTIRLSPRVVALQLRQEDVTNNLHATRDFTRRVQKLGCQVAICHFGTGLHPFRTLEHVQVDLVKLDASFVRNVQDEGEDSAELFKLVAQLKQANVKVIVPYIEQASMLPTLWQSGAHYIQGYYVQAPAAELNFDFSLD